MMHQCFELLPIFIADALNGGMSMFISPIETRLRQHSSHIIALGDHTAQHANFEQACEPLKLSAQVDELQPHPGYGRAQLKKELRIREVHQRAGLTIMLIEHKLREFMQLVSRVIAIDFGEIIATGSPQEIVDHPLVIEAYIGKQDEGHAASL